MQNLEVGQIVNTFGIKGFVKVNPFTDDKERFEDLKKIYVKTRSGKTEYEIEEVKYQKHVVLLKIKGIDTIEQANLLRDSYIEIDRENAVPLEEDSYFIVDLIGCEVYTDEDILLGKVDDVFPTGSHDIYVVKDEDGKQILLPAIQDVIKEVDIGNKKITVHLLPGLI